jgi:OmcA/MtrC family decaheme c-type cytochrome
MKKTLTGLPRILTLLIGFLLAACSGGGAQGPEGPQGPAGGSGPGGVDGPTGVIPVRLADEVNVAYTGFQLSGDSLTVSVYLSNDENQGLAGLPAGNIRFALAQLSPGINGSSSEWHSYILRSSNGIENAQGTTETASTGTWVDNANGTYEYTFANGLNSYPGGPRFDAAKTHRIAVEVRTDSNGFMPTRLPSSNAPRDFVPGGGEPLLTRLIVDNDTCNACHDNLAFHGGGRFDIEYCVVCHNPHSTDGDTGNTVDFKVLIHNIHSARPDYTIVGYGNRSYNWADLHWPQDTRNCDTCHEESDTKTPQASNYRLVPSRAACGTCHYDDGDADNRKHDFAIELGTHPAGMQLQDDSQCASCHGENAHVLNAEGRLVTIPVAHEIRTRTVAQQFRFNIIEVSGTAPGENPVVRFSVTDPTNDDAPYNIHEDAPFTVCSGGASRLSIDIGWDTRDYTNSGEFLGSGTLVNGLPIQLNPLNACGGNSTDNGDGSFTVTSGSAIPDTATGTAAIVIEGHPAVDAYGDGSVDRIAVTNAIRYVPITDATAAPRRMAVDISKCNDCHNQLSLHGNNRTDKPEVCVVCHNPNMTDAARRVDAAGACVQTFGVDDESIDFKRMIHGIHASNVIGKTYDVCGYGNSAYSFDVHYPGKINNCEGCHLADTYYPVDPDRVLGTTIDANDPSTPADDLVISPNAAICSSCHIDTAARNHMVQNGADFAAGKTADNQLVTSGAEACDLCHGKGGVSDVREAHGVGEFQFN